MNDKWNCGHFSPLVFCGICVSQIEAGCDNLKSMLVQSMDETEQKLAVIAEDGKEIDRLKSDLIDARNLYEANTKNAFEEIDRLKAELYDCVIAKEEVMKTRDTWKSKAEKLAEALRNCAKYSPEIYDDEDGLEHSKECPACVAKEALAEFAKGK